MKTPPNESIDLNVPVQQQCRANLISIWCFLASGEDIETCLANILEMGFDV